MYSEKGSGCCLSPPGRYFTACHCPSGKLLPFLIYPYLLLLLISDRLEVSIDVHSLP